MSGLVSAIDEWAAEDVDNAPTAALGDDLVVLSRAVARLEAEFARRLAVFDARGGADADSLPTAAWLRHRCRLSPSAAAARLGVARRLHVLPLTARAFADGDIGLDHARTIALVRDPVAQQAVAACEEALVEHAKVRPATETAQLVAHVVHAAAPEVLVAQAESAYERRRLSLSETFEGMFAIDGILDAEAGATLRTALHAAMAADRTPGETRTAAQARADALVALARGALDGGGLPETGGERPHLSVVVADVTLAGQPGAPAGVLGWAGVVPGETARRLGCDALVTRITSDPQGRPLDVGRTTRTVPPQIRRALDLRDGGCTWPGCDRPPQWTDAHHVVHWAAGGATALDNLRLVCRRHHRAVHEGGVATPATTGPP